MICRQQRPWTDIHVSSFPFTFRLSVYHSLLHEQMSAYLEEHLPHLQSLHAQLALPATALSSDQARLESAIRNAVTALIREREVEVDGWKDAIAGERKEISGLARSVGDKGRNVMAVGRRESMEDQVN